MAYLIIASHLIVPILGILLIATMQQRARIREERRRLFHLYIKCKRRY